MKQTKQNLKGLPNNFKKVGIIVFLLSFPLIFLLKSLGLEKEISLKIVFTISVVAILLFILAKEKIEDERIEKVRLVSFASAFIFTIAYSVLAMWLVESFNFRTLVLTGLLVYIFVFYTQKIQLLNYYIPLR